MNPAYRINDTSQIITPALVVFHELLSNNIDKMIAIAGDAARLRPHCKTHKLREVAQLELERGITKHKCATFAEAEMLAEAGVTDIFLAYNLVGPNIPRATAFLDKFPKVRFSVTADHPLPIRQLGAAMSAVGRSIDVLLDIDTGQARTGLQVGAKAKELYGLVVETPGLEPGGLHVYDGQNHQTDLHERRTAVDACWQSTVQFRDDLVSGGWPIPRIVAGGTGSFPIFAEKDDPTLELSPGTVVFFDSGYGAIFPDLEFTPAALLLTRVISLPGNNRVTLDLGYKACASDPPAGQRLSFPDLPDAKEVLQNEEHLVLETERAAEFQPGDELLAIPRHICPTTALHKQVFVVQGGELVDRWNVTARDRWITV